MKKFYLLSVLVSIDASSFAQISTFPYNQGFEQAFGSGINVEFLANITGNEVATSNRIFQDLTDFHSGAASCAIIPTSGFEGEITIRLDLSGRSNVFTRLWASSRLNGTGNRAAILRLSASTDNGATYSNPVQLGDSTIFANNNTGWNQYQYVLPYFTYNQPNVLLRIQVTRGNGNGTTAKLLLDDMEIDYSLTDITPPDPVEAYCLDNPSIVKVVFDEPMGISAENTSNYNGIPGITSAVRSSNQDTVTLQLATPLQEGLWYTLTVQSVADLAGNVLAGPKQFIVVFNDNVGNVKFTEIMYNNPGDDSLSFVEIKNIDASPVQVGGWRFSNGIRGMFPSGKVLAPQEYMVFANYPAVVERFFGITGVQFLEGNLSNSGEVIAFSNAAGIDINTIDYDVSSPWDSLANGYGYSLVLCDENSDNSLPANWTHALTGVGVFNTDSIYANPGANCQNMIGVGELENEISWALAPNPSNGTFHFEILENPESGQLKWNLYNVQGKKIQEGRLNTGIHVQEIQVNHPGVYYLELQQKGKRSVRKLIVF